MFKKKISLPSIPRRYRLSLSAPRRTIGKRAVHTALFFCFRATLIHMEHGVASEHDDCFSIGNIVGYDMRVDRINVSSI